MTDFYSQNRCVCSTRSHGPLLCAFCLSFHFNILNDYLLRIARASMRDVTLVILNSLRIKCPQGGL